MRVVQATFGVFHQFELARELHRRGYLQRIYSTWPWARLKREGLPRPLVQTFPWIHTPEMLLVKAGWLPRWLGDELGVWNARAFDAWTARRIEPCDAFIALAGAGLETGRMVQRRGGVFVCDRGSTHPRFQEALLAEEYRRWGVDVPASDLRDTVREEEIYELADAITVASSFAKRSFVECGVPAEKLHVIPYGVRLESFAAAPEPVPSDRFEVLFTGYVSLRKGVPYLLEAFARVRHPAKRLRLIGGVEPAMKQLLGRLPTENVEFLGTLPRSRVAECMRQSHVLVLPSVEDGFGLVMAEAMASGCPVISSTHTGGFNLYHDEEEGLIFPARDAGALQECLQRLADEPSLQRRMRSAALRRVQEIGGWSEYGDRWEELLPGLTVS